MRLKTDNRFHKLEVKMRQVQADVDDMKKVTKRELLNLIQEQDNEMQGMSREIKRICETVSAHHADIIRIEKVLDVKFCAPETCAPEPKLKQLDQSIFNGLDKKWRFAMVSSVGIPFVYDYKPSGKRHFISDKNAQLMINLGKVMRIDEYDYDTTNWQNSLIERKELTGSDLCRAMLERGDKFVMCANQSAYDDWPRAIALNERGRMYYISGEYSYDANDSIYPINNQGEPLTQSEAGL